MESRRSARPTGARRIGMKKVLVSVLAVVFAVAMMSPALAAEWKGEVEKVDPAAKTITLEGKDYKAGEGVDLGAIYAGDDVIADVEGDTVKSIKKGM